MAPKFTVEHYERFPDRQVEKDEFLKLITFADEARLLAIKDKKWTGKSFLLRWIKYHCDWTNPIAASLIDLDPNETPTGEVQISRPFELVARIREDLRGAIDSFPTFDTLYGALKMRNPAAFGTVAATYSGAVYTQGATSSGSRNITAGLGVIAEQQQIIINPGPGEWRPDQEEYARQECVNAFLQDLKTTADGRPVLIMLDSLDERCDSKLSEWISKTLVSQFCVDLASRPKSLVMVVAGRDLALGRSLKLRLGPSRYEELVRSRESLGRWEKEHVRAFLELNEKRGLSDADVEIIWGKVKDGATIGGALLLADALITMKG